MNYSGILFISLSLVLYCSIPVAGVTTYLTEGPHMSAAIAGTNEFSPGQDAVIPVIVQNRGLNIDKFVMQGTIEREDLPTTAKLVTVGLQQGNAPIIIKSDPQNIGELPSQRAATVRIAARITADATEGEYTLPLTIRYQYLAASGQEQADILESDYQWRTETLPLTIKIKPSLQIEVVEVVPENLSVGAGGYLRLKIKNTGFEDGKKATIRLIRNGNSPVIPADNSVYIGDFARNKTMDCRYTVTISGSAENQIYPVDVVVQYENRYGESVTSGPDTIGVPVSGKVTFTIVSGPASLSAGTEQGIMVQYKNTGTQTAYDATARLSVVEPFTSADNSAYLGDLKPGDVVTASYRIRTGSGAEERDYALDTEIQFRDSQDNSQISDTFRVPLRVVPSPSPAASLILPGIIGAAFVAGAGYYLLVMRKKK